MFYFMLSFTAATGRMLKEPLGENSPHLSRLLQHKARFIINTFLRGSVY
jgi:hypothetical protein